MRKIIVSEFVSLDGVMQAPGGAEEDTEGGFTQGGWTWPYWHDDIGAQFFQSMQDCDAFLLGRKTWEIHGGAFEPMAVGDPFGDVMNTMPKYVVSTTLTGASAWRNSTLIKSNVVEEVRALKAQDGKNIAIDGSSVLVHTLARAVGSRQSPGASTTARSTTAARSCVEEGMPCIRPTCTKACSRKPSPSLGFRAI